jgi:Tellurite resistance protein and related permeases
MQSIQQNREFFSHGSMQYFPVTLFSSIMGLCGLSIAYQRFEQLFSMNLGIGAVLLVLAYSVFFVVATSYLIKMLKYPAAVQEEFNHPIRANFFATVSISLMLLSSGTANHLPGVSHFLWAVGTVLQSIFTIIILNRWINRDYDIAHSNPAWFLPVVGNIIVPIAGSHFIHRELAWFFFCVGIFFWFILFTVIFYRIVFHRQIADKLIPTLAIMIGPPSLGFLSYTQINEQIDTFARCLLYVALFFVILLLSMSHTFMKLNFHISWWAFTFPLCAVTIAMLQAYNIFGFSFFAWLAIGLLGFATVVIVVITYKTLQALLHNEICIQESPDGEKFNYIGIKRAILI